MTPQAPVRIATPDEAPLLAGLYDQARRHWPDFSPERADGICGAITDDGMVYLLLGSQAAVCVHADVAHGYGFLDFPYADEDDADLLIQAALTHLQGLRIECPVPAERTWEVEALIHHGFQPGRTQRLMELVPTGVVKDAELPFGFERATATPEEIEALHDLVFPGHASPAGWRSDPDILPSIGAQARGQLVGYALATLQGTVGWLSELAIRPEFRRRGLGRALTLQAVQRLSSAGAEQIRLYVNDTHDQHAPHLYQGVGFQTISLTTRFIRSAD